MRLAQPRSVLLFWFTESTPQQWFMKDDGFDQTIRDRFGEIHSQATAGLLDSWADTPEGAVALVVVLDQFSRNMFRDSPKAFASDGKALAIAKKAIASRFDEQLPLVQRKFLYMPFMHSETLSVQDEGLKLFGQLGDSNTVKYAKDHREVIVQFGRFPGRNKALQRVSTSAEEEFLRTAPKW